jgi:AraC-like DNA-binding protein
MAGAQTYIERAPAPDLRHVVSSVWIQQVAADADPYRQRNIPNGAVELLCRVGAMPRVVGPLTRPWEELLAPGTTVVGMRLRPGAAPSLLGLPASELVDATLGADALLGAWGDALGELVDGAASPEQALAGVERRVAGRLAGADAPDRLVLEAVRQLRWRTDGVGELTSSLSTSERQLRRRCQDAVGLAPKTLHRMLRFQEFLALAQHAIALGHAPTDDGLARLAADAGYADQPHLNRECVRLTGVSPRAFLGAVEDACSCGHDHAASFAPLLQARPRA